MGPKQGLEEHTVPSLCFGTERRPVDHSFPPPRCLALPAQCLLLQQPVTTPACLHTLELGWYQDATHPQDTAPGQPVFSYPWELTSANHLEFLLTPFWGVTGRGAMQTIIGGWDGTGRLYICNYCYYDTVVTLNVFTHFASRSQICPPDEGDRPNVSTSCPPAVN